MLVYTKEDNWQNLITVAAQQQLSQRQTSGNMRQLKW